MRFLEIEMKYVVCDCFYFYYYSLIMKYIKALYSFIINKSVLLGN